MAKHWTATTTKSRPHRVRAAKPEATKRQQPTASDRYMRQLARLDVALERLTLARANHFGVDAESLTWGDVGDVDELANKIEAAANFIGAPRAEADRLAAIIADPAKAGAAAARADDEARAIMRIDNE